MPSSRARAKIRVMSRSTTPRSSVPKAPVLMHVVPTEGGWQVKRGDAARASSVHETQAEATEAARAALRKSGGELHVQSRTGQILESRTLGRDPMAKIAAVEGIRLSPEMKRTLAELDRRGVSGEERRRAVAEQFRTKR